MPTDIPAVAQQPTLAVPATGSEDAPDLSAVVTLVGQSFGDFEILAEIGRGGMGVVYKARQKSLDRLVALKMLLAHQFQDPVVLNRFLAEARAAASLTHPNIVSVYQVGECFAGRFFVMELIEGCSLDTLVRERVVRIPWAVSLMITVAEAVHHAHTKGIIHRDLKPANIMIDQSRRPVVMDFGIAKFVGQPSRLTREGTVMGTPAYMPPEQAASDLQLVGPPSDVYSLGAILYTLLTGKPIYDEGSDLRTLLKVISVEPPPRLRSLRPEVPRALEKICLKCLNKKPEDRYPTAKALAAELRRLREQAPAPPPSSTSSLARRPSVLLVSQQTNKALRIFEGTSILGRAADCDVVVKATDVSKRHCRLTLAGDQLTVEDLDSANGTEVNQCPVKHARLQDGDELDIGGHVFRVRMAGPKKG
jgi:serine/threonine protein kinase